MQFGLQVTLDFATGKVLYEGCLDQEQQNEEKEEKDDDRFDENAKYAAENVFWLPGHADGHRSWFNDFLVRQLTGPL
jgi:hypothetical protein